MQVKKQQLEPDTEQWNWFQIGNGVGQGCILSPCLFNFYAEYTIWNAGLDEAWAGIKLPGEITITSDMQMTPPLMTVKEESEKAGLKLNIQKMKLMASSPNTSWQ